jgi:cell division protein FtsI/penicillin-binding protein 2
MSTVSIFHNRSRIIFGLGIAVFAIFILRLYHLQIMLGADYRRQADRQYVIDPGTQFARGTILFSTREGQYLPAASTRHGTKVAITPNTISDAEGLYAKLAAIVPELERETFLSRASKTDDPYEEILFRLDDETTNRLRALEDSNLRFVEENWRSYPHNTVAAQTIGFVAYDGDTLLGRYGLERTYEEALKREASRSRNLFADILTNISRTVSPSWFAEGDVVTTLELSTQRELHNVLGDIQERWNAQLTGGIIMDPRTGAIIGMDSLPSFDPNRRAAEDATFFRNPSVENVYEMGSIMKPLIVASALDNQAITPDFTYNDTGSVVVNDRTIFNFDKEGRGPNTTLETVLADSLNTGMVKIEQANGRENTKAFLEALGLREVTGIDLPNESAGLTSNLDTMGAVEYANISFGQGIAITPIAMTRALASLANFGKLPTPHVGSAILYPEGTMTDITPDIEDQPQIFSPDTAAAVSSILVASVDNTLGAGSYKDERYQVAAKTGTAQIPDPDQGGYYTDRNLHTFFGYFPASNPRFLVFLYTVHPKGVRFSSQTLAAPFFELTDFLINYHRIAPDR